MRNFASISHEKLELPAGPFFVAAILVWLHPVMISIDFTENNTEVGHCPWVGLIALLATSRLARPRCYLCIF